MSTHTVDFQTIEYEGHPAFVLVPFAIFKKIRPLIDQESKRLAIPHEIVKRNVLDDITMIKAWREHLGLTQKELATKAGVTQPAIAKLERTGSTPRRATLKKIASAMGLVIDQIEE